MTLYLRWFRIYRQTKNFFLLLLCQVSVCRVIQWGRVVCVKLIKSHPACFFFFFFRIDLIFLKEIPVVWGRKLIMATFHVSLIFRQGHLQGNIVPGPVKKASTTQVLLYGSISEPYILYNQLKSRLIKNLHQRHIAVVMMLNMCYFQFSKCEYINRPLNRWKNRPITIQYAK